MALAWRAGLVVRWEVRPEGDDSVLTLSHQPVRREPAVDYGAGWHAMLDALLVHLDGGEPGDLVPDYERLFGWYANQAAG